MIQGDFWFGGNLRGSRYQGQHQQHIRHNMLALVSGMVLLHKSLISGTTQTGDTEEAYRIQNM